MRDDIISTTLSNAVFADGATLSGTWLDTYSSAGKLTGASDAAVTLTAHDGRTETFSSVSVVSGANGQHEIVLSGTSGDTGLAKEVVLGWSADTKAPAFLDTGLIVPPVHESWPGGDHGGHGGDWFGPGADGHAGAPDPFGFGRGSAHEHGGHEDGWHEHGGVGGPAGPDGGFFGSPLVNGGHLSEHAVCFTAGTMILTPAGEVAVETLREDDLVQTADGRAMAVRWLGQSSVVTRFADPLHTAPIRITAGALGEGLPVRDLRVSPAHAVLCHGLLVQAGALVNGETILRETDLPARFTYYHVELASHELLVSNGLPSESFVDNVERLRFDNWDRPAADHAAPIVEMNLPRVKSARQLPEAVRQALAVRAGKLGVRAA